MLAGSLDYYIHFKGLSGVLSFERRGRMKESSTIFETLSPAHVGRTDREQDHRTSEVQTNEYISFLN